MDLHLALDIAPFATSGLKGKLGVAARKLGIELGDELAMTSPLRLFELREVEGRRVGKLLLCQIGCKLCLVAEFDLTDRHGHQLFPDSEEAADREDHRSNRCMIKIKQRIFDLANRRVARVDLTAD